MRTKDLAPSIPPSVKHCHSYAHLLPIEITFAHAALGSVPFRGVSPVLYLRLAQENGLYRGRKSELQHRQYREERRLINARCQADLSR